MAGTVLHFFENPVGETGDVDRPEFSAELAECERLRSAPQDLLRAISHDLRAPVRHVTAFAPLLRELIDTPALPAADRTEALDFLSMMENAGQRMGLMLEGVLGLSRVAAAPLRLEDVDLGKLVQQVINQLNSQWDSEPQSRSIEWRIDFLPTVSADPALLRPALLALVGNAIKFTERAEQVFIGVSASQDSSGHWRLRVEDNGAGFDMARAQGLFDLFQRLHSEREFKGVGAGLALVRAVAERHGGSVSARAAVGSGCCVEMVWPACPTA